MNESEKNIVRYGSIEDRKKLARAMVQKLAEQEGPILAIENLHKQIKEAKENQQKIEDSMTCKVSGIFREISEQLGKKGNLEVLVKEYPTEKAGISGEGIVYHFRDNHDPSKINRVVMRSPRAYRSLVQELENNNDAQTAKKRWDGMGNLDITDKALNLAYSIAATNHLDIKGKYVNKKDEEMCKGCCWHGSCP